MERFLGKYSDDLYGFVRIVAGFLFACHGAQKLFGVLGGFGGAGKTAPLVSLFGLAGIVEFFGGVLIAVGLLTSFAAFIASGEMAAAFFRAHLPAGFWPIKNRGELAVIFCFLFLYFASKGAGKWSIAALVRGAAPDRVAGRQPGVESR